MGTYKFGIPCHVIYSIDESNLIIETMKDLKKLQRKHQINLDYVIEEYDYRVDQEREARMNDDDYVSISNADIFDIVINEMWDRIIQSLTIEKPLNELDDSESLVLFNEISKNFNSTFLHHKFNLFKITNLYLSTFNKNSNLLIIEANTENDLTLNEIEEIRKFIDNECSDGWGESFEEIDLSNHLINEEGYVYVKTWDVNHQVLSLN